MEEQNETDDALREVAPTLRANCMKHSEKLIQHEGTNL